MLLVWTVLKLFELRIEESLDFAYYSQQIAEQAPPAVCKNKIIQKEKNGD